MTKFMDLDVRKVKALIRRETGPFIGMTFASLLLCFLIAALIEPYKFASTGVTGVALITNYLWGMSPVWVLTIVNILLLIWGWTAMSPRFALWTLYNTVLTSIFLPVFEMFHYPMINDLVLAALLGGVTGGLAIGILFRCGGSSGGMDILAAIVKKHWGIDVGSASFYVNSAILLSSLVAVNLEKVLYGGLSLYVESVTIDWVLKSFDRRVQMNIITSKPEEIINFIMEKIERTATLIPAKGAYRRTPMDVIMVILTRRQALELKRYVRDTDRRAFVIMGDVSEVVGEGFKEWENDT
ncbi:MAG: YitT family protein [Pyramidobacter sp.]